MDSYKSVAFSIVAVFVTFYCCCCCCCLHVRMCWFFNILNAEKNPTPSITRKKNDPESVGCALLSATVAVLAEREE